MDFNEIWEKIVNWFNSEWINLLFGIAFLVLGVIIIHIIRKIVHKIMVRRKVETLGQRFVERVLAIGLYLIYLLVFLQTIGVPMTGMLAAFSALALAIALALKDNFADLANGVMIIFTKPFKQNDTIRYNGELCRVRDIRMLTTLLDTFDNRRLIVPNREMATKTIDNLSANGTRRVSVKFQVNHTTDLGKLREVCLQTMQTYPHVLTDPEPILVMNEIDKDGVHFDARCWCLSPHFCDIFFGLTEAIYNELKKNHIEVASRKIEVSKNDKEEIIPFTENNYIVTNSTKSPPAVLENLDEIGFDNVLQTPKRKGKTKKNKENV